MAELEFSCEWLTTGQDTPKLRNTVAQFTLRAGNVVLTRNEDTWSQTVRDNVLLSVYPLAIWLASSWWRLRYEPLPKHGLAPPHAWRMAHEIGAANHGYVWPRVVMAADGEAMFLWARASAPDSKQSVKYLNGLSQHCPVPLATFEAEAGRFIELVLSRLRDTGCPDTDLAALWRFISEDRADPEAIHLRRLEAQLGYDPEDCPDDVIAKARELEARMGESALSELAPIFGKGNTGPMLDEISSLAEAGGIPANPSIPPLPEQASNTREPPWSRAVRAAQNLRATIGNCTDPVNDDTIRELLGLNSNALDNYQPQPRQKVSLAIPEPNGQYRLIPRKPHPIAQRFELGRMLGDFINMTSTPDHWLAATDLATARQKFQRAFAAEFLCPIKSLVAYLDDDYSESAINDAAGYFRISEKAIDSLLANNGYVASGNSDGDLPYRVAA